MKVVVENTGKCRISLKITVPAEQVTEEFDKTLKVYTKKAAVPGFRKGKAPAKIVQQRFGKNILEDVKDRMIPEGYHQAIKDEKIDVAAVLGVSDVEFAAGEALSFTVILDVPPKFKLPKYQKISIKAESTDIADDAVTELIENLRDRSARFEDVTDRKVQAGDRVQIDYKCVSEDLSMDTLDPADSNLNDGEDYWCSIDENEFLPGLGKGLIGTAIGDEANINITFEKGFSVANLAGKNADYSVTVKAIREKKLPDIDEEFLKPMGLESEDDLRQKARENLEQQAQQNETGRRKQEIVAFLLKKTQLDLPESLVADATRHHAYDIARQNMMRGVSQDQLEADSEKILEAAGNTARDQLKLRYILHAIAEEEEINVDDREFMAFLQQMAARSYTDVNSLREKLVEKDNLDNTREDCRLEKTLDFLLNEAKIKE